MEKKDADATKGKVLLATVKGDVHDIGKNLVDIIFSNNGYQVVNLGIKVPPEQLVEAFGKHAPDVIGLSGLLVKSAQQMVTTAEELTAAGVTPPMLVGGAALTEKFTDLKIAAAYGGFVTYAKDAMDGLRLLLRMTDPRQNPKLVEEVAARRAALSPAPSAPEAELLEAPPVRSPRIELLAALPPPNPAEHILEELDLPDVWRYINDQMLYGKHLGFRGSFSKLRDAGDPKALELAAVIEDIKGRGWIRGQGRVPVLRGGLRGQPVCTCARMVLRWPRSPSRASARGTESASPISFGPCPRAEGTRWPSSSPQPERVSASAPRP